jgi:hypothetical protein
MKRPVRLALMLAAAVLVGINLATVVQPLVNSRAAADPSAITAFATGGFLLIVGFGWR